MGDSRSVPSLFPICKDLHGSESMFRLPAPTGGGGGSEVNQSSLH